MLGLEVPTPFPRMTYDEAMRRFGVDRPDVRFGVELVDLTSYFAETPFRVFQAAARRRRRHAGRRDRSRARSSTPGRSSPSSAARAGWPTSRSSRTARSAARSPRTCRRPSARACARPSAPQVGDCAFFAAGTRTDALALLGATRLEIGRRLGLMDDSRWEFLWVTDFPMFEPTEDGGWTAVHHPFTAPADEPRGDLRQGPGRRAGAGVRPHPQRHRARRRLDPHPLQRRAEAGLRRHRAHARSRRASSSASCSRRSPTARRRTAASPSASTASPR